MEVHFVPDQLCLSQQLHPQNKFFLILHICLSQNVSCDINYMKVCR